MDLLCVRCRKPEIIKDCKGNIFEAKPNISTKGKTLARLCSICTHILLFNKQSVIPWEGEKIKKEAGRLKIKRRR